MKIDQFLVALVVAAMSFSAGAATICVQNKATGIYEPKGNGNPADCEQMNQPLQQKKAESVQRTAPATAQLVEPLPAAPVEPPVPKDPAQQQRTYKLNLSDIKISMALKRWAKDVRMQLAYEAEKDFDVPAEAEFEGTFSDVVTKVMSSLKQSSYPLRACEYDNRLLLVKHRNEACPLESEQ